MQILDQAIQKGSHVTSHIDTQDLGNLTQIITNFAANVKENEKKLNYKY